MTRLIWDQTRPYEMGLDRGVFYPPNGPGEAWNGLVTIAEREEGDIFVKYIDGRKIEQQMHQGFFSGTISAYTYPPSFYPPEPWKRNPYVFGMSYRGGVPGNQKIHLVYNVRLAPSAFDYQKESDLFRWDFTSLPVPVPEAARSAHLIVDSSVAYSSTLSQLENVLYGTEAEAPRLPTPAEVFAIFEENAILKVTDHGDGTFSVEGPDTVITMLDSTTFQIDWPSVVIIDADNYKISSL